MIKLLLVVILVFILSMLEYTKIKKGKQANQYTRIISILHMVSGITIAVFATVHGIGHISTGSIARIITGSVIVILLYLEVITGIILRKKETCSKKRLKIIHKINPIILLGSIILHILL